MQFLIILHVISSLEIQNYLLGVYCLLDRWSVLCVKGRCAWTMIFHGWSPLVEISGLAVSHKSRVFLRENKKRDGSMNALIGVRAAVPAVWRMVLAALSGGF
jgi:hypothetical protein